MILDEVLAALEVYASPDDALFLQRFFKTAPGEYGAGDTFIGVRVPDTRRVAAIYKDISLADIETLLESPIHEMRLCAVIIMVEQSKHASVVQRRALYDLYLSRTDRINNWDIVDVSCRDVIGGYLLSMPAEQASLQRLAASRSVWERRIAIVSTYPFIREGQLELTFTIALQLLHDSHDLIQKAVGWMLREAGKRDVRQLHAFLQAHAHTMPRTCLRYAIKRLDPEERSSYMAVRKHMNT